MPYIYGINTKAVNKLVAFLNLRDKYHKNIAKESALSTNNTEREDSGRFSFSNVVHNTGMFARANPNAKRIITTGGFYDHSPHQHQNF